MAHPKDRAAIVTRRARDICRDISDAQAAELEDLLRDEFAEGRGFAVRLLNDGRDELGLALRSPGEFPIRRETAQRVEENLTRAVKLLTKIENE